MHSNSHQSEGIEQNFRKKLTFCLVHIYDHASCSCVMLLHSGIWTNIYIIQSLLAFILCPWFSYQGLLVILMLPYIRMFILVSNHPWLHQICLAGTAWISSSPSGYDNNTALNDGSLCVDQVSNLFPTADASACAYGISYRSPLLAMLCCYKGFFFFFFNALIIIISICASIFKKSFSAWILTTLCLPPCRCGMSGAWHHLLHHLFTTAMAVLTG